MNIVAHMQWRVNIAGGQNFYLTDYTVYPKLANTDRTDVMLVQFLVKMYFLFTEDTGIADLSFKFWSIHETVRNSGKPWVDGSYGSKTRDAVQLFERASAAPYRDGIVRPICDAAKLFGRTLDYGSATKLEKLNWTFDHGCKSNLNQKSANMKSESAALWKKIYQQR